MRAGPCGRGFTLLELLVALAIFGLLSVMAYSGLRSVLEQQARTQESVDRLAELQKVYLLMQRDIEQAVPRIVRGEYGDDLVAFGGDDMLQLTRGGWRNPLQQPRSSLQRVAYAIENDRLTRYTWSVLDRAQDSVPLEQPLTEAVRGMQLRFMNEDYEWLGSWPPVNPNTGQQPSQQGQQSGQQGQQPPSTDLPNALEVTLDHEHYGQLVWLFRIGI